MSQANEISDDLIWAMAFEADELDPAPFIKRWVKTRNEEVQIGKSAYQYLPIGLFHLRILIDFALERGIFAHPLWRSSTRLVSKGRQLLVTWVVLAIVIYIALRYSGSRIGIIAQKGDKSADHLERLWEIIKHFPGEDHGSVFKARFPAGEYTFIKKPSKARITVMHPDGLSQSDIHAFTQTISDPRSLSLSFVFMDEAAFIPKADEYYSAIKPAIDSTQGKIFITSTHSEDDEFFWDMCYEGVITDKTIIADGIIVFKCNGVPVLEMTNRAMEERREEYMPTGGKPFMVVDEGLKNLYVKELRFARKANPGTQQIEQLDVARLTGLLVRETVTTDLNGNERVAFEIPDSWLPRARSGISQEKFDRENRCKRTADESKIVFKNFKRDFHVRDASEFPFIHERALIRGWDPGSKYAACVIGQVDDDGRFVVHYSMVDEISSASTFAAKVKSMTRVWFPTATTILDYGDPSGSVTNVKNRRSDGDYYQQLRTEGIYVQYSYQYGYREDARINHIKTLLDLTSNGIPLLVILNHKENKYLIKAFEHEYRWEASGSRVDKSRRPYADNMDALAYAACQATSVPAEVNRKPSGFRRPDIVKNANKKYASGSRKFKPVTQVTRYR